jgi:hypothetical protein
MVPPSIAGAMQYMAAGVLLCTIVREILPEMVNTRGLADNLSLAVDFLLTSGSSLRWELLVQSRQTASVKKFVH